MEKDPSGTLCWDSNSRPLEHKSPPITTWPWFPVYLNVPWMNVLWDYLYLLASCFCCSRSLAAAKNLKNKFQPSGKRHLFSVFRLFGLKNQSWWYCTRNDTDGIWTVDLWCQKQRFYQMFKFPPQKSIPISPVRRLNTNNSCGRPIIIMHKLTYSYKC